ncbi:MAG TPA: hypothetical protein VMW08_13565 [Acidimicrobiales bacterium]|nr:hypothetical protein [Acidimicrobiales bacterium]
MDPMTHRQQVLFLWLEHSDLDGRVVAWTFHDGADRGDRHDAAPYANGVAALRDGWRLIQTSPIPLPAPGAETVRGRLEHEFMFERIVPID